MILDRLLLGTRCLRISKIPKYPVTLWTVQTTLPTTRKSVDYTIADDADIFVCVS